MSDTRVVIVGGGLSGLYSAYLLEQAGFSDFVLLEGRSRFGGRIETISPTERDFTSLRNRFDTGATWFWPDMQPELAALIRRFRIPLTQQFELGKTLVERRIDEPPLQTAGYPSFPTSVRVKGGMQHLVDSIRSKISPERLLAGHQVISIHKDDDGVAVKSVRPDGSEIEISTCCVVVAVPPRLAAASIRFEPPLPPAIEREWDDTGTWMAPHAKFVAVYDQPFWRERGLSGQARSSIGPLAEIHCASSESGDAALFGFVGVPAEVRWNHPEERIKASCRAQLERLFGAPAGTPKFDYLRDWSKEPFTATSADKQATNHHSFAHTSAIRSGPWSGRIVGVASEWSAKYPGYLAGAIDAAQQGVVTLNEILELTN